MNDVFGSVYAHAYDALYQDKDYDAECQSVADILETYGEADVTTLLDLGCGTGNHTTRLAQRGYKVTGVDRSQDMLDLARQKAMVHPGSGSVTFCQSDIRCLRLGLQFDAAMMLFAVLGYQIENSDVLSALRSVRRHLRPCGLFVFDVWYGPAVLHQRPSQRIKVVPTPGGQVLRTVSTQLDTRHHTCEVRYQLWRIENEHVIEETEEAHSMRFFFPLELELLLEATGFTLLRLGAFPEFDSEPDETSWNVMGIARAQ